ncbi:glycoside hydrolase family protein [Microbacterium enclense]|uniref:glycoside hydrolase family protein n=1 Tax=Microbacterium enclense TaxID=993073 RepID=UPI0021A6B70F|nr:glycoside hydrolase family protein [Microbacterium enclense]MCT2087382.1 glycoside hydrolase family protein [Microbacterium enclense]
MKTLEERMSHTGSLAAVGMALTVAVVAGIVALGSGVPFPDRPSPLRVTSPSLLFASSADVRLSVDDAQGPVTWSVSSRSGTVVDSGTTKDMPTDAIAPKVPAPGLYSFSLDDGRGPLAGDFLVTDAMPATPDPFFAVATHWGKQTYASSTWPLATTVPLVTGLGFGEIRDETTWTSVERAAGAFTIPDFASELASAAEQNDLHMLFVASYGNPRAYPGDMDDPMSPPTTDEGRAAFVQYIDTVLDANPNIDKVEVWNEFNRPRRNTSDCQSGACYATLVRAVHNGVKAKHPDVKIVAGNTHGIPSDWFADFMEAGGLAYADALSIHGYASELGDLRNGIRRINALARAHNGGRSVPIIVSEVGLTNTTTTPPLGNVSRVLNEDQAAAGLTKIFVTLKSLPAVEQTVWYAALDDGSDPTQTEANFGLYRQPTDRVSAFQPKIAAAAMATVVRQLDGYSFTSVTSPASQVSAYTFTDARGDERRVMWRNQPFADTDNATTQVEITTPQGQITNVRSATGEVVRVLTAGTATIEVGSEPLYFNGGDAKG